MQQAIQMSRSLSWRIVGLAAVVVLTTSVAAQTPKRASVKLSEVLSPYVPAAGTQTRGLPWTTGSGLPVKWETAAPVKPTDYEASQGFTMKRVGAVPVDVGKERMEATLQVLGNQLGIQQVTIAWRQLSGPFDPASQALLADGVALKPLKCRRETEGASYGNVVNVAQFKDRIGVALWENWNCGHDGCGFMMTLLYRRTAVDQVECAGGPPADRD